ncbi:MAG: PAS domain S-box protein [Candidatus Marinimicrobia bacterium]|nr:PAS domain S-box protein [Candidatus Neomarinimicrobiota bacterium]
MQDITERKNIENELKEKTSFLSTIMETSPVGIVTIDKAGNITYANYRAEQILGLEKEQITSTTYNAPLWKHTDLDGSPFPEEKLPFNVVKKSLNTVFDVQHGITWPDGTVVILSVNAAPIKDHNGEFNGMIASIEDITERKESEKALRESEEKYRTLVNSTLQGVIIAQSDPVRLVFANPAMAQISGYSSERLLKMDTDQLTKLIYKEDRQRFFSNFQKRLKGENIPQTNEYRMETKDGTIKWVALYSSKIEYQNEPASLTTFMDITERKRAEKAVATQKDIMTQAEELAEMGSWKWDIKNDSWVMSDNWKKIHGIADIQLSTHHLLKIAHPEDTPTIEEAFTRAAENGEPYDIQHRIIRQDTGEIRYVSAKGLTVFDAAGKPKTLVGASSGHHRT